VDGIHFCEIIRREQSAAREFIGGLRPDSPYVSERGIAQYFLSVSLRDIQNSGVSFLRPFRGEFGERFARGDAY
jgi:hypothetical protein